MIPPGAHGRPAVFLHTLGCPKNEADSGRLARRLAAEGVLVTDSLHEAGHILVNTCGFVQEAVEESIDALLDLVNAYPDKRVAAMGCLVERHREELRRELPELDAWFGLTETDRLVEHYAALASPGQAGVAETSSIESADGRPGYTYVKISDGCDHRCSFCAIPAIKGRYRALSLVDIVEQVTPALEAGVGELVLVGQDTTIWRSRGMDLLDLVGLLGEDERVRRLRVLYLQPEHVTPGLLELMAEDEKLCRYLDIPLQHASEPILRSMGRGGDAAVFRRLLGRARELMPDVSLRTTFIVGFPGETDHDFEELLEFASSIEFDHAGVFAYSPEEGTPAAALADRPGEEVVATRMGRLSRALADAAEERAGRWVGRKSEILVDRLSQDDPEGVTAVGRLERQAPEVDGVVFLTGSLPAEAGPGALVPVEITESVGVDLFARWSGA